MRIFNMRDVATQNGWFLMTLTVVALAATLSSCASVQPKHNIAQPVSVSQASQLVRSHIGNAICKSDNTFSCGPYESPEVKLSIGDLVVDNQYKFELATLKLDVSVHSWPSDSVFLVFDDGMAILEDQNQDARYATRLSDALLTLKNAAILNVQEIGSGSDAGFAAVVSAYRNAATNPVISENARMYTVQAEGAIRDKELEEAAFRYCKTLAIAPWWPEAHFNRALVLGEMKEYGFAVREMRRYLALVPAAPDAQAAQDKIYEWERKAGTRDLVNE
jgi:hypothetical protein